MREEAAKKWEQSFNAVYDRLMEVAKETRDKLKAFCSVDDLEVLQKVIKVKETLVNKHYKPLVRNQITSPRVVKRMDACVIG